ncbi:MAG: DUF502 domain-containing protein [Gemmatimonadota bacterium]|nr:DUF502 domain-containing protein [Gemmatimonadota bacterium]MDH5759164.1 DUF502 domain-containing protein [Gemmatimonadota bacterium]
MTSGLVVMVPVVVTLFVLRVLLGFTAGILLPVIDPAVEDWPILLRLGLSLAMLFALVYVLGEVATNLLGRRVLQFGEGILLKVPFVKVVYAAAKQVVAAFQGQRSKAFKSVVFIEFPRPGMRAVAFVTGTLKKPDGSVWNTVFVPTTPNPTTGFLQIVPREEVVATDFSVEEGVKMIMSLGVLVPERMTVLPD